VAAAEHQSFGRGREVIDEEREQGDHAHRRLTATELADAERRTMAMAMAMACMTGEGDDLRELRTVFGELIAILADPSPLAHPTLHTHVSARGTDCALITSPPPVPGLLLGGNSLPLQGLTAVEFAFMVKFVGLSVRFPTWARKG
jgi:hypothetical protein